MNRLFASTALATLVAFVPGVAFAGSSTDIQQIVAGVQQALNNLSLPHNSVNIDQNATNAANLVNDDELIGAISQAGSVDQTADNLAATIFGMWTNIQQTAVNVASSINLTSSAGDVYNTTQSAADLDQVANNRIEFNQDFSVPAATPTSDPTQSAVNAINLLTANDVWVRATQSVDANSSQNATNNLVKVGGDADGRVLNLVQEAANVANSISVDNSIAEIDQDAYGLQSARNFVSYGSGTPTDDFSRSDLQDTLQTATNVSNIASATTLATFSDQVSAHQQTAINTVDPLGSGGFQIGDIDDLTQEATNATNLLTLANLSNTPSVIDVYQNANVNQFAQNNLPGNGGLTDIIQTATNIANSLSNPTP